MAAAGRRTPSAAALAAACAVLACLAGACSAEGEVFPQLQVGSGPGRHDMVVNGTVQPEYHPTNGTASRPAGFPIFQFYASLSNASAQAAEAMEMRVVVANHSVATVSPNATLVDVRPAQQAAEVNLLARCHATGETRVTVTLATVGVPKMSAAFSFVKHCQTSPRGAPRLLYVGTAYGKADLVAKGVAVDDDLLPVVKVPRDGRASIFVWLEAGGNASDFFSIGQIDGDADAGGVDYLCADECLASPLTNNPTKGGELEIIYGCGNKSVYGEVSASLRLDTFDLAVFSWEFECGHPGGGGGGGGGWNPAAIVFFVAFLVAVFFFLTKWVLNVTTRKQRCLDAVPCRAFVSDCRGKVLGRSAVYTPQDDYSEPMTSSSLYGTTADNGYQTNL